MPYIKMIERNRQTKNWPDGPGQLNWIISDACNFYMKQRGVSYQSINDVVGALEGAKLEFYRRIAVPYEDQKLKENGDVY